MAAALAAEACREKAVVASQMVPGGEAPGAVAGKPACRAAPGREPRWSKGSVEGRSWPEASAASVVMSHCTSKIGRCTSRINLGELQKYTLQIF